MPHIIGCLFQHDLRLVAVACVLCAVAAFTTLRMLARARAANAGALRWAWIAAGGFAFGSGVWVTHFVGILAYAVGFPIDFDLPLTALSLAFAILGGGLAIACAVIGSRVAAIAAGILLGATIGVMHFVGMAAMRAPGVLEFRTSDVVAAWIIGVALAPMGMLRFRAGHVAQATALLVLAVAGLHFTAMAAITIRPDGSSVAGIPVESVAAAAAAIGLLILFAALGSASVDAHLQARNVAEHARFRRFADATFEGMFFVQRGFVSDANAVLCNMLRRPASAIVGSPLSAFFSPACRAALDALAPTSDVVSDLELIDARGNRLVVDLMARNVAGTEGDGDDAFTVVAVWDASERIRSERRIRELAQTDPLTGLSNRLVLHDRLSQALARAERTPRSIAVLRLDLDHFKAVNDLMGERAGDRLLVEVAGRLRANVSKSDSIVRTGGDQFVIIQTFEGMSAGGKALAARLLRVLAEPYSIEGRPVEITASIGIAAHPTDSADGPTLLEHADLALDRAKEEGRGVFRVFESAMDTKQRARRALEQDLRHALANHELHMNYQPVFDAHSLALVGYEALLRWSHPRLGPVPPSEFIPIAEECGAILPIGLWTLETACAEAVSWLDPLGIAVNLSPAQFNTSDLPNQISAILARTGLDPGRLELEVTEGVLIGDVGRAAAILGALKAQGIRIALDDFGTGYSSLSYLRRFAFDRVKIDRSFVVELDIHPDADAIVRAILAMSRSLGLHVTAEGVETEQQLDLLRRLGCDRLQGYLLGRPTSPKTLAHASIAPVSLTPELAA